MGVEGPYIFCTLHRAELTDRADLLREVLHTLGQMPIPVVFAVHPRTSSVLGGLPSAADFGSSLHSVPALGYFQSLSLTKEAAVVLTDSGGVQREAYWLGTPCVTIRSETEWVETVEVGANRLLPPAHVKGDLTELVTAMPQKRSGSGWDRNLYGDGSAARLIVDAAQSALDKA